MPDVSAPETTDRPRELPRWAVVAGRGRCRVLAYEGNGYFTVMTNRDVRLFLHRSRITFVR